MHGTLSRKDGSFTTQRHSNVSGRMMENWVENNRRSTHPPSVFCTPLLHWIVLLLRRAPKGLSPKLGTDVRRSILSKPNMSGCKGMYVCGGSGVCE
ncbi:hypothetical protein CEXT_20831 [Caerostris extrusa]|uniref:Uncharacterized protein n=1 Tax=Caerostris extrusa TaxID=172846 RepID=A0AAV4MPG8_CAEEX|nr:hypothetical protein CEXT_20831 [Caerostris extrusa]